jgi:hypothetical protein
MTAALTTTTLLALSVAAGTAGSFAGQEPSAAMPVEPIAAILNAFRSHAVVALTDPHGNDQVHAFVLSLLKDPRIPSAIDDIVVENGSSRYQDLMDRYVTGEDVPYESLRQVWDETTQPQPATMSAGVPELYRTVRAVNASIPRGRWLRVVLGDPPIDWGAVRTREDVVTWIAMRDSYPADLIQRDVLARGRRALVIYGQMHFQRRNLHANYETGGPADTLVSRLERTAGIRTFTIWAAIDADLEPLQAGVESWRVPSLANVRGTALGAADFTSYYPLAATRFTSRDTRLVPIARDQWRSLRMEDQFDAVLYLGPRSAMTRTPLSSDVCADSQYVETRLQRIALAGLPEAEAAKLKTLCGR